MALVPQNLDSSPLASLVVQFETRGEQFGPCPDFIRTNYTTRGGTISGLNLHGAIHAWGSERCAVRADGVVDHEARLTLELADGALVALCATGLSSIDEQGYEAFLQAKPPPYVVIAMHCRLNTSAANYLWLNRLFIVGLGIRHFDRAELEIELFALSPCVPIE